MTVRTATTIEIYLIAFFENMSIILRQNEELIKIVRQHKMFLTSSLLGWPFLIVAFIILRYAADFNFFGYWWWFLVFIILIVLIIILHKIFIWRNNGLVITNMRIIENEQRGIFNKLVTELLFDDIKEISYEKNGLNASIYNFGDLKLRTASENEVTIERVSEPEQVVDIINQLRQKKINVVS